MLFLFGLLACVPEKGDTGLDTADDLTLRGLEGSVDADEDGYPSDEDCDDENALTYPGADELCDGEDNNCDGDIDEGVTSTFYEDEDGDGYGDPLDPAEACDLPDGYATNDTDCDDRDAGAYPDAEELCDGVDNDCNGNIDEGVTSRFYEDDDGDGFGDAGEPLEACAAPEGYVSDDGDCNDGDPESFPGNSEQCDSADNDCDGEVDEEVLFEWFADSDGDGFGDPDSAHVTCDPPVGYVNNSDDCNDNSSISNPDGVESCDLLDNDCDGDTDEGVTTTWYRDEDGDHYGVDTDTEEACTMPSGFADVAGDCDDNMPTVFPSSLELCDEIDNDCDGDTDEDDAADASKWYADTDGDGYGDYRDVTLACVTPSGYVDDDTDCDDTDSSLNPGMAEVCDEVDNDCNGFVDAVDPYLTDGVTYFVDADEDGYGNSTYSTIACELPYGYTDNGDDCDDGDSTSNPAGSEVCDGADNDCDGTADEDASDAGQWFADADRDGYGDASSAVESCVEPLNHVPDNTDCDDTDNSVNPGGTELCDSVDNDCDGDVDEEAYDALEYFGDSDGDGYGSSDDMTWGCSAPSGYVRDSGDCDDSDGSVHPTASEVCGGSDEDCDGLTDEDDPSLSDAITYFLDLDGDGYGTTVYSVPACTKPSRFADNATDCDDTSKSTHPGAAEVCDGADNDCDGTADDGVLLTLYHDGDRDGYGDPGNIGTGCIESASWLLDNTDCDDTNRDTNPAGSEVCDGDDNDCDGDIDDDDSSLDTSTWLTFFPDSDGDGSGTPGTTVEGCQPPTGYAYDDQDCDDADASVYPLAEESCDAYDNNCNGQVDEGLLGSDAMCPGLTCNDILISGNDDGDGLYWIDPDDDGLDAFEAFCDMTLDGGGWTKLYSSQYPTFWSSSDYEEVGDPEDDDYSMLALRDLFTSPGGTWTLRLEVGTSGSWDSTARSDYTVWDQQHDPIKDSSSGSDYTYISGTEPSTCGGFNGLHDAYYASSGVYALTSEMDSGDSTSCMWMQVLPLQQYGSSTTYPGYVDGYSGGGGTHTWQVLWVR